MKLRTLVIAACSVALVGGLALAASYSEKIHALWGSDITVEQLMLATDPGQLSHLTAKMRATKVTWGNDLLTVRMRAGGSSEGVAGAALASLPAEITVSHDVSLSSYGMTVSYGAKSEVVTPYHYRIPYMSVEAYLLEDGATLDYCSAARTNVYRLTPGRMYTLDWPDYYQCVSHHYMEFPAGCDPQTAWVVLETPIYWLD